MFLANLSSASFWIKGTQTTWYVYGILVFYLLFPLIYTFLKKSEIWKQFVLLLCFVLFAIGSFYVPILNNSMIVWARLPIFTIGIMVGSENNRYRREPRLLEIVLAIFAVIIIGWLTSESILSDSFKIQSVYRLLLNIPLTLALLLLFSKVNLKNGVFEWIGGLSLEIYLIHITLFHPLKYYGIIDAVGYWLYLILPITTFLIAWIVGLIEKKVLKLGVFK